MLLPKGQIGTTFHELSEVGLLSLQDEEHFIQIRWAWVLRRDNIQELWEKTTLFVFGHFFETAHDLDFPN